MCRRVPRWESIDIYFGSMRSTFQRSIRLRATETPCWFPWPDTCSPTVKSRDCLAAERLEILPSPAVRVELSNLSPNSGDNPVNNRFAVIETSTPFSRLCRTDGLLITDYRLAHLFLSFMLFLGFVLFLIFLPVFFLATFFFALRRILTNSSIRASTGSRFFALRRIHTRASRRLSTASCSFAMQHSTSSCQPVHPRNPHRPRGCPQSALPKCFETCAHPAA